MLTRLLSDDYEVAEARSAADARERIEAEDFALVLCDIDMPGESGLELARELSESHPELAVTMVTGTDDVETAKEALELGAYGYIVKPFRPTELLIGVANGLRRRELEIAAKKYAAGLEQSLLNRSAELSATVAELDSSLSELEASRLESIQRLNLAVAARDHITAEHVNEMTIFVERFARLYGFAPVDASAIGIASAMHDVGKIGIPDSVLLKPGSLDDDERQLMQQHAEIGHRILAGSPNKLLQLGATIAWTHHERWDGRGYPRGLKGEKIPLEARVVQIVDVYSALTTDRPYRGALDDETAKSLIRNGGGTQFDPMLVALFLGGFDSITDRGAGTQPPIHAATERQESPAP
jgi:putative two-component system response regulator